MEKSNKKQTLRTDKSMLNDDQALVNFLNSIMGKSINFVTHFDSQVNILVGISTALIALSVTGINSSHNLPVFYVLGLFSMLSVLTGLYAIHPPKKMRKQGQGESLFYNRKITKFATPDLYAEKLKEVLADRDMLVNNYSAEIYNLYKYYYRPKRDLFNLSRNLLLCGIVLGFIVYIFHLFI